jgi:predicted nucleic acid-binding protein
MSSVYIETSIISYLTARVSRDLIVAGHQQMTEEWWSVQRNRFELWASELVVEEASAGDASAAAERLKVLNTIEMLDITEEAGFLATALIERGSLPAKASADALHIAIAAVHNVDYLLTWNCKGACALRG